MTLIPRVHIEFSAASSMAAIVRRGPSRWVRLLAWNTADDTVTPGSWFHGRIYEHGAHGVDPQGRTFQYADGKLVRDGRLIVDLGAMMPDPERPPDLARTW